MKKDQITDPPTLSNKRKRQLTKEEDELATKILTDYGVQTTIPDPSIIRIPATSNGQFGQYLHYSFEDANRMRNVKKGCPETKYAQNFYNMTGKSAFAKKS